MSKWSSSLSIITIPGKFLPNQLHRNPAGPEACGLYTMRGGFQWPRPNCSAARLDPANGDGSGPAQGRSEPCKKELSALRDDDRRAPPQPERLGRTLLRARNLDHTERVDQ